MRTIPVPDLIFTDEFLVVFVFCFIFVFWIVCFTRWYAFSQWKNMFLSSPVPRESKSINVFVIYIGYVGQVIASHARLTARNIATFVSSLLLRLENTLCR